MKIEKEVEKRVSNEEVCCHILFLTFPCTLLLLLLPESPDLPKRGMLLLLYPKGCNNMVSATWSMLWHVVIAVDERSLRK